MRASIWLFPTLCLIVLPAFAQEGQVREFPDNYPTYITLVVEGRVMSMADDEVLPLPLIERLVEQKALGDLDMEEVLSSKKVLKYKATFVFRTMQALRDWYTAEDTQALFRELTEENGYRLETALNVRRTAYARALDG